MMEIWRYYLNENKLSIAPQEESEEPDKQMPPFKIPAIIPIVLHTGSHKWKAPRAFKEIIKESERFNEHILNFNSLLIDTSQIGDETFLKQKSVIALVMYLGLAEKLKNSSLGGGAPEGGGGGYWENTINSTVPVRVFRPPRRKRPSPPWGGIHPPLVNGPVFQGQLLGFLSNPP